MLINQLFASKVKVLNSRALTTYLESVLPQPVPTLWCAMTPPDVNVNYHICTRQHFGFGQITQSSQDTSADILVKHH
jgi:hypothetical protein